MRINRVELKNYRIHRELSVDFAPGINLLLGKNGSGKSSILEAIGIAMFSNSPRSSLEETVSDGEKSGSILIEFLGNDQIEYIVEKKIGSTNRHIFYKKNEANEKITDSSSIIKKIKALCGIPKDSKNIFESVISASQNKIVDIFLGTDIQKKNIFNEIFDTKIYREIYEKYARDAENNYSNQLSKLNGSFDSLKEKLPDIGEITENLQNLENEKGKLLSQMNNVLETHEKFKKRKSELDEVKKRLDFSHKELENKIELLEIKSKNLQDIEIEINISFEAEKIITQTAENYEKYNILGNELKILEKQIEKKDEKNSNSNYI